MTHEYIQNNVLFFLFLAPYARTTRYEEAFFPLENQGKKGSLRSRASLLFYFFANKFKISTRRDSNSQTNTSTFRGLPRVHRGDCKSINLESQEEYIKY